MWTRIWLVAFTVVSAAGIALGQAPARPGAAATWQSPVGGDSSRSVVSAAASIPVAAAPATAQGQSSAAAESRQPLARVTSGNGTLPNEQGQLWREYDITPYTLRVTSTNRPEQAIVDWIIRETGYEAWHTEPVAVLSANSRTLRVYHTPQIQAVVADLVERFVSSEAQTHTFSLRVVTVSHPNWRERAQRVLRPVQVQAPGAQAWLLEKEAAALLLADLRRRTDYREHSSPHLMVNNGQSTVVTATRGRNYVRDILLRPEAWPGFEPQTGIIDEGFSLEFSPLLSVDAESIDATIKCQIDQVEKMVSVMLDVPTSAAPRQRTKVEIPQIAHFRFHERFRWPGDQVLLVSLGMVPLPVPSEGTSLVPAIPLLPLGTSPSRAEILMFIESKGRSGEAAGVTAANRQESGTYRGRY